MNFMKKILIIEDEKSISEMIRINLVSTGYICECAYDGQAATQYIEENHYDLILLDVMLPIIDGFTLMEYIKEFSIPTIFITAKSHVEDRVKGLKLGADDYIVKPFEIIELLARIETVLRRYSKNETYLSVDNIRVDTLSMRVFKDDQEVKLTNKEYQLLVLFLENKNIVLFRERIYELVWNESYFGDSRTVDLHVQRLRKKLELTNRIVSVYKVGYRLEVES